MSHIREVVVVQLVERSLPIPEVCGLNPVTGKIYLEHLCTCLLSTVLKRQKINKKRPEMAHFKKKSNIKKSLIYLVKLYYFHPMKTLYLQSNGLLLVAVLAF